MKKEVEQQKPMRDAERRKKQPSSSQNVPEEKARRTGTDEVPVLVIGGKLLVDARLDNVDPLGNRQTAGALKVSSVLLDKVLCGHVLDSGRHL